MAGVFLWLPLNELTNIGQDKVPEVTIPAMMRTWFSPAIDGDWWRPPEFKREWGWTKAPVISDFVTRTGEPAKERTEVWLFYNASHIYLAITCYESEMTSVRKAAKAQRRPAPMPLSSPADSALNWHENVFEIFIRPDPSSSSFYQLAFNPAGHKFDQALGEQASALWDGDWRVAIKLFEDRWQAEVCLRISSLAREGELRGTPRLGSYYEMTFCRSSASGELSSWGRNGWHHPENGRIVFGPKPRRTVMPPSPHDKDDVVVDKVEPGNLEAGRGMFKVTIFNPAEENREVEGILQIREPSPRAKPKQWSVVVTVPAKGKGLLTIPYRVPQGKGVRMLTFTLRRKDLTAPSYIVGARFIPFPLDARLAELKNYLEHMRREIVSLDPRGTSPEARQFLSRLNNFHKRLSPVAKGEIVGTSAVDTVRELSRELKSLRLTFSHHLRPSLYLAHQRAGLPLAIGLAHPSTKIFPDEPFGGPFVERIHLALAKNEYESAQVVLLLVAESPLTVHIHASPLSGPKGALIPPEQIEFHRVGWVLIDEPSLPIKQGLWPDPLYPTDKVTLKTGQPQPVMVTVYATPTQRSGIYRGKVRFVAEGYSLREISLEVEVYPFALPRLSPFHNEFWFDLVRPSVFYGRIGPERYEQFVALLAKYRCPVYPPLMLVQQHLVVKPSPQGKLIFDFRRLEPFLAISHKYRLNRINLTFGNYWGHWRAYFTKGFWFIPSGKTQARHVRCLNPEVAFQACLKAVAKYLESKGWWKPEQMFFIGGDEPWAKEVREKMRPGYVLAKEALPWLKRTAAAAHPGIEGLDDLIDIWCPQIREFQSEAYVGDDREVWMYTCGWKHPLPCFSIPVPGISPRMLYWVCRKFKVTGFLYWGTNAWVVGEEINRVRALPPEKKPWVHDGWRPRYVGDGFLLYPTPEGPIPSQRLLNIRDGVEDWLYLDLLDRATKTAEERGRKVPQEVRQLSTVPEEMVSSTRKWNKSAEKLEALRRQVARELIKLSPPEPPPSIPTSFAPDVAQVTASVPKQTLQFPSSPEVLYQCNFDDGEAPGWHLSGNGRWAFRDGALVQENMDENVVVGIWSIGHPTWSDFVVRFRAKFLDLNRKSRNRMFRFRVFSTDLDLLPGRIIAWWKPPHARHSRSLPARIKTTLELNRWYQYEIEFHPHNLTVRMDDSEMLSVANPGRDIKPGGPLSFSFAGIKIALDDFVANDCLDSK